MDKWAFLCLKTKVMNKNNFISLHIDNTQDRKMRENMRSVSREKLLDFEGIFRF